MASNHFLMGYFWNEEKKRNKVIFTRTKKQKMRAYGIIFSGLLLFFVIFPVLMAGSRRYRLTLFLALLWLLTGISLLVLALFASKVNFRLFRQEFANKSFRLSCGPNGDVVEIDN
jgi:hypothetical protein